MSDVVITREHQALLVQVSNHAEDALQLIESVLCDPWSYDQNSPQYLVASRYLTKLGGKLQDCVNTISFLLAEVEAVDR